MLCIRDKGVLSLRVFSRKMRCFILRIGYGLRLLLVIVGVRIVRS